MDKVQLIEGKIMVFFQSKVSFKERTTEQMLSLKAAIVNDKVEIVLLKNGQFLSNVQLAEVIKLTTIESFLTSDSKIEKGLIEGFRKKAEEKNISIEKLTLEILPAKKYFIYTDEVKEEITIQEIL